MTELGPNQHDWGVWYAFMAPRPPPPAEFVQRLNIAINHAMAEEAIATRIRELGTSRPPQDAGRDARFYQGGVRRFRRHREGR